MTVTAVQIQEQVKAEDDELALIQLLLEQATDYVTVFINKEDIVLTDEESNIFDRAVSFVTIDWYLHRDSSHTHSSFDQYTGLNAIINLIRKPAVG